MIAKEGAQQVDSAISKFLILFEHSPTGYGTRRRAIAVAVTLTGGDLDFKMVPLLCLQFDFSFVR